LRILQSTTQPENWAEKVKQVQLESSANGYVLKIEMK
jgi:hypothetical protein